MPLHEQGNREPSEKICGARCALPVTSASSSCTQAMRRVPCRAYVCDHGIWPHSEIYHTA